MKIFILVSRMPYPLEKGDKLRAFQQIKAMSAKHDIHLFALNPGKLHEEALNKLKPYCKSIRIVTLNRIHIFLNLVYAIFRKIPFSVGFFYSPSITLKIEEKIKAVNPDLIFCQLIRMAEYVKEMKTIPKIIDYQDVFSRGMALRANRAPFYLKPFLRYEEKLLRKYENKVYEWFNEHIIISTQDRAYLPHPFREKINVIPNSIDRKIFKPVANSRQYDLLFVGNMNYEPNIDCVVYLVKEILPLVKKEFPSVTLEIAGANPCRRVLSLASSSVHVTGWVNNISECYARARIFCAPMRLGTGLQNKLLEAMAMQLPCITTSLCNNALNAEPGKSILIGEDARSIADHIMMLLKNKSMAEELAKNANILIQKYYDEPVVNHQLLSLIDRFKKN